MAQTIVLGATQIIIAICGNALFVMAACGITRFLYARPRWALAQRYLTGMVLGFFAVRMVLEVAA